MMNKHNQWAGILLTVLLTSLLCISLFYENNKYTHNALQPICAQLSLSEEDLNEIHYLIDDWAFYPDVLLTPEQLQAQGNTIPMYYTSIGDATIFRNTLADQDPHGYGTYVMHLWLPEESESYTLELPEIFSAYRLFINGEVYLQCGNPDPLHYAAQTQSQLVSFCTGGHVELVIQVNDQSHFYSGIVYPPAFGQSAKVMQIHQLRQASLLLSMAIGLILVGASVYLGLQMRKDNALLFALLCMAMCISIGSPYLHTLVTLPVFPWYALEITCIYLMPLLTIILLNRICFVPVSIRKISVFMASALCLIALAYGLLAPVLTVSVMKVFSVLFSLYKILTAAYLLSVMFFSAENNLPESRPIYYATFAYATIVLWDRLLPSYEPIFYGWFMDFGNLILVLSIGYTLLSHIVTAYLRGLTVAEEHRQICRQLTMQKEYSRRITEQEEKHRRLIHDFRHQLRTILMMAEHQSRENLLLYVESLLNLTHSRDELQPQQFSRNSAVDALLNYYYAFANQQQIQVDIPHFPETFVLSDVEFCAVLGNLLENAVEACLRMPPDNPRRISLHVWETDRLLFVRIENTYDGIVAEKGQTLLSRKQEMKAPGIGINSAREIIEAHGGTLDIYSMEQIFRVGISLPAK